MNARSRRRRLKQTATTSSAAGTLRFGRRLAARLLPGDVIALSGQIGAGKTTLAKGIVCGLGAAGSESEVVSPTFTLIQTYPGSPRVHHLDWYRLGAVGGADLEMACECFDDPDAVSIVEWPERAPALLPARAIRVLLEHAGSDRRRIAVQ